MEGRHIIVVTGLGEGHLQPSMHLCLHLANRNYRTTLVLSSSLSSSTPSSFTQNPLISLAPIAPSSMRIPSPQSAQDLHHHLLSLTAPLCAVVDFQMSWTKHVFWQFRIPVVSFFTFGGCAAAMEWAAWKLPAKDLVPGESRLVPGLPHQMAFVYSDLKRKPSGGGGPKPGDRPPWVPAIEGSIAMMFNTCDHLDGPFIKYLEDQTGLPAWSVGPLLPEKYWQEESFIGDGENSTRRGYESNFTQEEVVQWLASKSHGSVIYVAFGSEVGPTLEEYQQLAQALEESTRPFIWVIQAQKGYCPPEDMREKVGDRGLIIQGWAPQLLILAHSSVAGFLSHCGWNSTMEALGVGVPILSWPIRGDQFYNAKLVVNYLQLGYQVASDLSQIVKKDEILQGIERLLGDEDMHTRATAMKANLKDNGFPASSQAALDGFTAFIIDLKHK